MEVSSDLVKHKVKGSYQYFEQISTTTLNTVKTNLAPQVFLRSVFVNSSFFTKYHLVHSSLNISVALLNHRRFFRKRRDIIIRVDIVSCAKYFFWNPHRTASRGLQTSVSDQSLWHVWVGAEHEWFYLSEKFKWDAFSKASSLYSVQYVKRA